MAGVPFLPGYSFPDPTKTSHAKKQSLGYKNGYALSGTTTVKADDPLPDTCFDLTTLTFKTTSNINNTAVIPKADTYIHPGDQYYKKVLSFDAYSREVVGIVRYRYTKINYFLEDETIQVLEPKVENSGIPQGVLLRRQKVPRGDGQYYHWEDLQVGVDVTFFGKEYHLRDCDPFTRTFFLDKKGIVLHDPEPEPAAESSIALGSSIATGGSPSSPVTRPSRYRNTEGIPEDRRRLRKFLDNDRKVLRFYCVWDDSGSLFGDRRPFILHYFLVDDCIELREVLPPNSGRDPSSSFMKKQRLPKNTSVFSSPTSAKAPPAEYYTDADLKIGTTINIGGRKFLIYDLDQYTREYYSDKYGVTDFPVLNLNIDAPAVQAREIPPYTGFGSEEDSLANCLSLLPKPPRKLKPKQSYNSTDILRFSSTIKSNKKEDIDRQFVVSYHLQDDTISVFENPIRGIRGGKFFERKKLKHPDRSSFPLDEQFYLAYDLYKGGTVSVYNHIFELVDCDTYTTQFLMDIGKA